MGIFSIAVFSSYTILTEHSLIQHFVPTKFPHVSESSLLQFFLFFFYFFSSPVFKKAKNFYRIWRNGSKVRSTGYSSKGPRFDSYYAEGCSKTFVTTVPGNPISFLASLGTKHTDVHAGKTVMHLIKVKVWEWGYTPLFQALGKQRQIDLRSRPTWSTKWVSGQPGLHSKNLFQINSYLNPTV